MSRISGLPELTTPADVDLVEILDVSDTTLAATGTNKKIKWLTMISKLFASRFATDSGSTDTYVVTLDPVPLAYVTGEHYRFKANTANTGACTVNFNSLGSKTIKKAAGGITTDLADNDIRAGQWVDLVYDGTNMQMQSLLGNAPAGGVGGFAASGANSDITSMAALTGSLRAPTQILDSNGNEVVKFGETASAVNEVTVTNKATGSAPTIEATGDDTDISLNVKSKGAGVVQANGVNVLLESLEVFASDLSTALTTGTSKGVFFMPYAMAVTEVFAGLATPQTSGSIFTVDINEAGSTILSTKITIDNTEDTSLTAATPSVISDVSLAKGAKITIDIDQIGDGTAKGLVVVVSGVRG